MLEIACWVTGVALLALWSVAFFGGEIERRQATAEFEQARAAIVARSKNPAPPSPRRTPAAIVQPRSAPAVPPASASIGPATTPVPIALLRIPRLALEVPVFGDTSERNLNRGAGWIEGTAAPDEGGNIAIAAHRDRYFRALKDVAVGDVIELESLTQRHKYRVTRLSIVRPDDTSWLHATRTAAITLVTCYPFYYVGHAPKRYIVRAVGVSEMALATDRPGPTAKR
jgi:LPXTG-site transpeptidase (sortase) family protein